MLTLPNQDEIPGYNRDTDGNTFSVEIATKNQYQFYDYYEPQENQDKFWQAKNMTLILKLFKDELDVDQYGAQHELCKRPSFDGPKSKSGTIF